MPHPVNLGVNIDEGDAEKTEPCLDLVELCRCRRARIREIVLLYQFYVENVGRNGLYKYHQLDAADAIAPPLDQIQIWHLFRE